MAEARAHAPRDLAHQSHPARSPALRLGAHNTQATPCEAIRYPGVVRSLEVTQDVGSEHLAETHLLQASPVDDEGIGRSVAQRRDVELGHLLAAPLHERGARNGKCSRS